jgi:aspartyl-tRNA synthetase
MNGKAEDLMMNAPNKINELQLKELGIKLDTKTKLN